MKKIIFNIRLDRIVAYLVFVAFFTTSCFAFTNISPLGSRIEDEPSGTSIEKFLENDERKKRSVNSKNQKLEAVGEQINYGHNISKSIRMRDGQSIKREQQKAENTKQNYIIQVNEGKNENGTKYKRYSGKSLKLVKHLLKMLGLHSKHYSEISELFPENHAHEWSLLFNYQQSDDSKIKFNFTINDKQGLSQSRYGIFRNKVFAEEKVEENEESKEDKKDTEVFSDLPEENNTDNDKKQGSFHWVDSKVIQTDIEHKTGSVTYGNSKTEAYNLITSFHEKRIDLNSNKVTERDVEKEYNIEKKVATNTHITRYTYNSVTGSKEEAHIQDITREMSPEDYVKSSEGEWMLASYKETIKDNRSPDKVTTRYVERNYDEEDRVKDKKVAVHEESEDGLDKWYATVERDISYLSVDDLDLSQVDSRNMVQIDGEFSSKAEAMEAARNIAELKVSEINKNNLTNEIKKLQIQKIDGIIYDKRGNQLETWGSTEIIGKDGDNVLTRSYDFNNNILERDDMERVISREEIRTNDSAAPGKKTITKISDIEYDYKGMQKSYFQKITEEGNGLDRTRTVEKKDIKYNGIGKEKSYTEISYSSSAPDKTTTKKVSEIEYNEDGLRESFYQEIREEGPGLNKVMTVNRKSTTYNALDQVVSYEETRNSSSAPDKTTTVKRSDIEYNEDGQMVGYHEEITEKGPGLDHTVTRDRKDIKYNNLGQIVSYREVTSDSSAPDKTTTVKRSDIEYNEDGQMVGYHEEITEKGPGLDHTITRDRKNIKYNDLGQMSEYEEIRNDSGSPDKTTTVTMSNIEYNENGQMVSYRQERKEEGLGLNHTVTVIREDTTYNDLGQEIAYTEERTDSGSPDKTTTVIMSDIERNEQGLITDYTQEITEAGPGLDHTMRVERENMTYNDLGQVESYKEITNDVSRDEKTTKEVTEIRYDQHGRKEKYVEEVTTDQDDITTHNEVELKYNDLGLTKTKVVNGWEDGTDDKGKDYHREFERTSDYTYDEHARVIKTKIESWDSENPDYTTYTTTEIKEFNGLGQPVRTYTDLTVKGDDFSRSGWKRKYNIIYDETGQEEEFDVDKGGDVDF